MKIKTLSFFLVLFSLVLVSCSSDDSSSSGGGPSATTGFKWKENSTTATENTAASSNFQASSLFAKNGSNATIFEINLMQGSAVGTYTFDGDYINGTALTYVTEDFNATSGTITITEKTATEISGSFEAHGTGNNGLTVIYGTFTDIPVQ
jgi:hypothetical protein